MKALLCIITAVFLSACSQESSPRENTSSAPIKRIVALSPSLSEAAFALGYGDCVVGVTAFADYPPDVLALPKVGGYSEINMEAVYALNPDVVLALEQQREVIQRLQSLNIRTASFNNDTLEDIIAMFRKMGALLGREARADELITEIQTTRKHIAAKTKDRPKRRVLVSVGRNMGTGNIGDVYVAGANTIYGQIIDIVGGVSAFEGPMPYAAIGKEAILRMNPEVILDLIPNLERMSDYSKADAMAQWQIFDAVDAVKNRAITICTANYICVPGPRVAMTMRDLAKAIHPTIDFDHE